MKTKILIKSFLVTLFLCNANAVDGAAGHMVEALPKKKKLEKNYIISIVLIVITKKRIGLDGPPLIPKFLRKYKEKDLAAKIKNGFPQTLMPKYEFLTPYELNRIARYIKSPIKEKK